MENTGAGRITIEVIKAHCLGGGNDVEIGKIMVAPGDLSLVEAEIKVRMGYAVVVADDQIPTTASPEDETDPEKDDTDPEGGTEVGSSEEIETGDPTPESRDPASPRPNQPRSGGGRKRSGGKK